MSRSGSCRTWTCSLISGGSTTRKPGTTCAATDTAWGHWWVVTSDGKKSRGLNVISHVLSGIPYEHLEHAMSNYRIVRIRATTGNRTPRCTTFQRPI